MSLVGIYIILSSILKATTEIDICIPCIWKTVFGFHCPGCGLTTAFIELMKFNFKAAFESNWLIYPIIPTAIYFIVSDFRKYRATLRNPLPEQENNR